MQMPVSKITTNTRREALGGTGMTAVCPLPCPARNGLCIPEQRGVGLRKLVQVLSVLYQSCRDIMGFSLYGSHFSSFQNIKWASNMPYIK